MLYAQSCHAQFRTQEGESVKGKKLLFLKPRFSYIFLQVSPKTMLLYRPTCSKCTGQTLHVAHRDKFVSAICKTSPW